MQSNQLIRKIRIYSLLSFLLPLITINICLAAFKLLGSVDTYENYDWSKEVNVPIEEFLLPVNHYAFTSDENTKSVTFTNCPKYLLEQIYVTNDGKNLSKQSLSLTQEKFSSYIYTIVREGKIKSIIRKPKDSLDSRCIKNHKIGYFLFKNISILEKYFLSAKKETKSGFGKVKNPYLYGEISISRSARYFPATLIFKPFIILSAFFLFFYWINNLKLFNEFLNKKIINKFSKKFFYFGVLSSIFLILHASFLGLDFGSEAFKKIRKIIIVSFIFFEACAQFLLTKNLFEFKENLKKNINQTILKIKIAFVFTVIFITIVSFSFLAWGDISGSAKHVLEWNYFSFLLIYYFLSRLLWKFEKN